MYFAMSLYRGGVSSKNPFQKPMSMHFLSRGKAPTSYAFKKSKGGFLNTNTTYSLWTSLAKDDEEYSSSPGRFSPAEHLRSKQSSW